MNWNALIQDAAAPLLVAAILGLLALARMVNGISIKLDNGFLRVFENIKELKDGFTDHGSRLNTLERNQAERLGYERAKRETEEIPK